MGLGIENQADAVDSLGEGEIGQVVAAIADLREGLLGRAVDLELEDKDTSESVGYEVGAPLRLSVLGDNAESTGGEQHEETALVRGLVHVLFLRSVGETSVEGFETSKEGGLQPKLLSPFRA